MSQPRPSLVICVNFWTFTDLPSRERPWTLDERLARVAAAGFDAVNCSVDDPALLDLLTRHGLRFGGAFDADSVEQFAPAIRANLAVGDGPINCQLADHDTPTDEAVRLTTALMEEADRQGAHVHLEIHRNTCTETPEKTTSIIEGVRSATGRPPLVNFDLSHPAIVKHLAPDEFATRLFDDVPLFQQSRLWHVRPFNGSHCQVPVTDGRGNLSNAYENARPFIREGLRHWLAGPRPGNELWVVPELGPVGEYGLDCFPNVWEDAIVLGNDIKQIWTSVLERKDGDCTPPGSNREPID